MNASREKEPTADFIAPKVCPCLDDPARRALYFKNAVDARQYHLSLLRNGTEALICVSEDGASACVCEVRQLSSDEILAWMNESETPVHG